MNKAIFVKYHARAASAALLVCVVVCSFVIVLATRRVALRSQIKAQKDNRAVLRETAALCHCLEEQESL